tara:strand:+ start:427 stop:834 length:408 start_codon:yes stop_codon:yes gene_type:complete
MDRSDSLEFEVCEPSDNAQVVFSTRQLLADMGFDEIRQYLIASAVSELSTNIIRYAGRGTVTLNLIRTTDCPGIEIIAQDLGPGIADIERAMTENISTGNGLGLGLPSVQRIMDEFDIRSAPGQGTRVRAVKWMK